MSLRLVVVIDNFEDVLDLETRQIADAGLAGFYRTLATGLTRGSRVILTCRYLPAGTPTDQSTVMHLPLTEFKESDFRKFLRRDAVVEARISRDELKEGLLHDLYKAFGGTPGFLDNLRKLLQSADPDALRDDLKGSSPEEPGDLSKARESYFQWMITSRLYEALSPDARDAARRLAVSELPLPVDAVAKIVEAESGCAGAEPERLRRLWPAPEVRRCRSAVVVPPAWPRSPLALRPGASPRARRPRNRPPALRLLEVELRNGS